MKRKGVPTAFKGEERGGDGVEPPRVAYLLVQGLDDPEGVLTQTARNGMWDAGYKARPLPWPSSQGQELPEAPVVVVVGPAGEAPLLARADDLARIATRAPVLAFLCGGPATMLTGPLRALDAFVHHRAWVPLAFLDSNVRDALLGLDGLVPDASEALRMLADAPVGREGDALGYAAYADAIAGLIHNPATTTPLTLAVNAPWGAGKSSLARMVAQSLEEKADASGRPRHVVCTFDAWMHDDAQNLATAFTAEVAQAADKARSPWRRWLRPLPVGLAEPGSRLARRLVLASLLVVAALGVSAFVLGLLSRAGVGGGAEPAPEVPWRDFFSTLLEGGVLEALAPRLTPAWALLFTFAAVVLYVLRHATEAAKAVGAFVADPQAQARAGSMAAVRDQLGDLIGQATRGQRRFVVFVDDLERCRPPKSVDVMEAVSQLLRHPDVVVIVLADMPAVAACAELKYKALAESYDPEERGPPKDRHASQRFGQRYLQKIVQIQFDLPPPDAASAGTVLHDPAGPQSPRRNPPRVPKSPWADLAQPFVDPLGYAWRGSDAPTAPLRPSSYRKRPRGLLGAVAIPLLTMLTVFPRSALVLGARVRPPQGPPEAPLLAAALGVAGGLHLAGAALLFGDTFLDISRLLGRPLAPALPADLVTSVVVVTLALPALQLVALSLFATARWRRSVAAAEAYGQEVEERLEAEGVEAELPVAPGLEPGLAEAVRRERTQRFLGARSPFVRQASEEAAKGLPMLPRNAKRLHNRIRLLLFLAWARGMLRQGDVLRPRHVGKWALLQERWPELTQALLVRAEPLETLEAAAARCAALEGAEEKEEAEALARYREAAGAVVPMHAHDEALRRCLGREPFLAPHVGRLLRFEPPQERGAKAGARAGEGARRGPATASR